MSLLQAVILGAVQGLTEFLPISSSGHLIVVPWLLGWPKHSLAFDVALHLGTLVSLLVYFRREWVRFAVAIWPGTWSEERAALDRRMLALLVLGTIPAALAGILGADAVEEELRSPLTVAIGLASFGLLLLVVERIARRVRGLDQLRFGDALLIGLAQALALAPGISRSGATITMGLLLGLQRTAAARFSFLLATPIVLGAGLLALARALAAGSFTNEASAVIVGFLMAAVSGFLAIQFLLAYLQRGSLNPFGYYRIGLGLLILALSLGALR